MGRARASVFPGKVRKKTGGRQPGSLNKSTLRTNEEKEALRTVMRAKVRERWAPMIDAQLDNAIGIKHFMLRDAKTGQFRRITEPAEIDAALAAEGVVEGTHYWIYTKDPASASAIDLMNRVIDKPIEPVDIDHGGTIVLKWEGEK